MATPTEESYSPFQEAYDFFNRRLFADQLPACLITFQRQKRIMGYVSLERWVNDKQEYTHELAINPEYFANYPLVEICQTLAHEMVHIWQAQFGAPGRRGYHNLEWAYKMIEVGLMPSTTGEPGGEMTGESVCDYIVDDGAFITAYAELEQSGFQLTWKDRYPVMRKATSPVKELSPVKLEQKLTDGAVATAVLKPPEKPSDDEDGFPYTFEQLDEAFTAAFASQLQPASTSIATTQPRKPNRKHKYRCPQCHMQLWGKPELFAICGACNKTLVETD